MAMSAGEIQTAFNRELGRKIVETRKARKWTQSALALEIGTHRNTLERWEQGMYSCPLWMLLRIADVLCCNHLHLLPAKKYTWSNELKEFVRERDPQMSVRELKRMGEIA